MATSGKPCRIWIGSFGCLKFCRYSDMVHYVHSCALLMPSFCPGSSMGESQGSIISNFSVPMQPYLKSRCCIRQEGSNCEGLLICSPTLDCIATASALGRWTGLGPQSGMWLPMFEDLLSLSTLKVPWCVLVVKVILTCSH